VTRIATVLYRRRIGAMFGCRCELNNALKGTGQCDLDSDNQEGFAKAIQGFVLGLAA